MTFSAPFSRVFRPAFGPGLAAASSAWWLSGGIAAGSAVAVYQPKGAASLAASYTNLANPGTYDAAPGTAPTWDATNGWILNATHVLLTGISAGTGMSMLVRFSGVPANDWRPVIGDKDSSPRLVLWPSGGGCTYNAGGSVSVVPWLAAGVLAVAGQQGYRNGSADGGTISTVAGTFGTIRIGIIDEYSPGFIGNIQAVAIYSDTLTAGEVAAVSAAMAAL